MSFVSDLINGADNKFDHSSLNALQKVTLRAVVMAFLFLLKLEYIKKFIQTKLHNEVMQIYGH